MSFDQIRQWAADRNLIEGATPQAQFVKLMEEAGELAAGIAKSRQEAVVDGIGDIVVVLTILAAQHGVTIEDCIATAYNEIKDRKGRLINGSFVKEADLPKVGWIEWNGGECPVPEDMMVEVRFRAGDICDDKNGGYWTWRQYNCSSDIVAYRVVQL